jgi:hypothetical protein
MRIRIGFALLVTAASRVTVEDGKQVKFLLLTHQEVLLQAV